METSIQLSLIAFEKFKERDMKEALKNLNQIKNLKKNNEQTVVRIQHNILICEFIQAESVLQKGKVIEQLEKLISEIKQEPKQKSKENEEESKNSKIKQKQQPKESNQQEEEHDISLLILNLAQMYYLNKNQNNAYQVLMNYYIHNEINSQNQFIRQLFIQILNKIKEISLQKNNMINAMKILKILINIRQTIEDEQMNYLNNYLQKDQQQKEQEKDKNDTYNQFLLQKHSKPQICSLICGFVLNQHGETKLLINLKEYSLLIDLFKAQVLINLDKYQLATLQLKQVKSGLKEKESQESLLNNQKGLCNDSQSLQLFQQAQKQILNIYKYQKALNAYKQNNFKKTMMYLNPSNELKLNINNMGVHNQMYAVIQLNNIGCIHLKMKKPVLAVYYLSRALEVHINKQIQNSQQYMIVVQNVHLKLEYVKYNLCQALLLNKKTELAQKSLEGILQQFKDKYRLWFMIGSQLLQQYHEIQDRNQQKQKYDLYEDVLDDYAPRYKVEEQQVFRRYVLAKPSHQSSSQDNSEPANEGSCEQLEDYLRRAVSSLRNCLHLLNRREEDSSQDSQTRQTMVESLFNINIKSQETDKEKQEIEQQQAIKTGCLVKLAYALLSLSQFNHAYAVCQQALQQPLSDYYTTIINTYLLEIYMLQGKLEYAQTQAQALIKNNNGEHQQFICRNILYTKCQQFSNTQYQVMLFTNMASMELMNGRMSQAQKYIKQCLQALEIKNNQFLQIPLSLLNLTIYIQLLNGNQQGALNIIKRKRIIAQTSTQAQPTKPMLKITK